MLMLGKLMGPKRLFEVASAEALAVCERWDVPHEIEQERAIECASPPQPGSTVSIVDCNGVVADRKIVSVLSHANGVAKCKVMMPVPDDLNDLEPRMVQLANGRSVSGRLLNSDYQFGGPVPLSPAFLALVPLAEMLTAVLNSVSPALLVPALVLLAGAAYLAWDAAKDFKVPLTVAGLLGVLGTSMVPAAPTQALPDIVSAIQANWPVLAVGAVALFGLGVSSMAHRSKDIAVRRFTRRPFWGIVAASIAGTWVLPHFMSHFLMWLPAVSLPWLYSRALDTSWAALLVRQQHKFPSYDHPSQASFIENRMKQAVAALRDTTPLITIGRAKGVFTGRQDGYAPDAGKLVKMSVQDTSGHCLVVGDSGSGKTSGVLRPLVWQWAEIGAGGVLVLDPEKWLASELADLPGYTVIQPGVKLGLMDGLNAQAFADAVHAVCASFDPSGQNSAKENTFFTNQAYMAISNAGTILEFLVRAGVPGWSWTVECIRRVLDKGLVVNTEDAAESIEALVADILSTGFNFQSLPASQRSIWDEAYKYWTTGTIGTMASETKSNLASTVSGWLIPFTQHEELIEWSKTSGGIDISDILFGKMYGVCLPNAVYGRAGELIQSLLKERVFSLIRRRPRNWHKTQKPVLILVDEAQYIAGEADAKFSAVAREFGAHLWYATQSLDAITARLGSGNERDTKATKWFTNFQSQIIMKPSAATRTWASAKLGKTYRPKWQTNQGAVAYEKDSVELAQSALMDTSHPLYEHMRWLRNVHDAGQVMTSTDRSMAGSGFREWVRGVQANEASLDLSMQAHDNVKWEEQDLFTETDASSRLVVSHVALVNIWRAGAPRRDIVELPYMGSFPLTGAKAETKVGV